MEVFCPERNVVNPCAERLFSFACLPRTPRLSGASTVSALLAADLGASGQRVLLIDADLRRGTQRHLWDRGAAEHAWRQLCGVGGARSLQEALLGPDDVLVIEGESNVHVLPAGLAPDDSLALLGRPDLGELLRRWGRAYDLVLVE